MNHFIFIFIFIRTRVSAQSLPSCCAFFHRLLEFGAHPLQHPPPILSHSLSLSSHHFYQLPPPLPANSLTVVMGTLHIFPDLPHIDFDSDFRHHQTVGEETDLYWPSVKSRDMPLSMSAAPELDMPHPTHLHALHKQRYPTLQDPSNPYLPLASWNTQVSQLQGKMRPMPSHCDGVNPLPYNLAIPRDASPDGWWSAGERPAMEQGSCSGGSTWSPRTSEGRLETDPRSVSRASWREYHDHASANYFPSLPSHMPKYVAYSSQSSAAQSIAPCEIQLYPDPDSDEMSVHSTMRETKWDQPYGSGALGLLLSPAGLTPCVDDETISSVPDDDDLPMDDDIRDDDASDYTPPIKPSHRRNSSRAHTASLAKRPTRTTKAAPAKLSKITKRGGSSAKSTAATPSPTSPAASRPAKTACSLCSATFQSVPALRKHTLASHTRPFTCSFGRYGCPSTFGSKNEWKRHVSSQHLRPGIYRCDIGACVPLPDQHRRKSSSSSMSYQKSLRDPVRGSATAATETGYNDFNRKDLFTQHVRRMHGPPASASRAEKDAFDESLETTRGRCWILLREPPPRSSCGFCCHGRTGATTAPTNPQDDDGEADDMTEGKEVMFEGAGAWDERMEHVGKHLERSETDEREDEGLRDWMVSQGLVWKEKGAWRVAGCGGRRRGRGASDVGMEKDGEGDDGEEDGECDEE